MTPIDYALLLFVPSVLIYFVWDARKYKKRMAEIATRKEEQEAEFDIAFNEWVIDPSVENHNEMKRIMEEKYGQET